MFNTIFGQLGQGFNQGHMAQQNAAQATQYGCNQLQNSYPGYVYSMQQAQAQQALLSQQASMAQQSANQVPKKKYRIDGQDMDFEEFINTLYPDDCAEKTHLILKLKKED